ncbi:MAG: DEAD/DEAH box helicase [Armatimonadetes bacterium]|nr:DEAD/DEAH box helicase [Armatimonadota bacterium]
MPFSEAYYDDFDSVIRKRGEDYFIRGKVRFRTLASDSVIAVVYGSQPYTVALHLTTTTLNASCDCPHYDDGNLCKHLWAVMLALNFKQWPQPGIELPPLSSGYADDDSYNTTSTGRKPFQTSSPSKRGRPGSSAGAPPPKKTWRNDVAAIRTGMANSTNLSEREVLDSPPIIYAIDLDRSSAENKLHLQFAKQGYHKNGTVSSLKPLAISHGDIPLLPDATDQQIVLMLLGSQSQFNNSYYWNDRTQPQRLIPEQIPLLMPLIASTGRCVVQAKNQGVLHGITWQADAPIEARIQLVATPNGNYSVTANLFGSNGKIIPFGQVQLMIPGVVLIHTKLHPLHDNGALPWVRYTHTVGAVTIPAADIHEFLENHYSSPTALPIELPSQLGITEVSVAPTPILRLSSYKDSYRDTSSQLQADIFFGYNGLEVPATASTRCLYNRAEQQLLHRDRAAEQAAMSFLVSLNVRHRDSSSWQKTWTVATNKLSFIVRTLSQAGWVVEAEGKIYRTSSHISIAVQSGIDWFEVHGTATFGDTSAGLPQIVAALLKGNGMVLLDDGSYGLLPEEWLKKYEVLGQLGEPSGDHIRFQRSQTGMLDALLLAQPEITFDKGFRQARQQLQRFKSIKPAKAPKTFVGTLRQYQKEGLGWIQFLQKFRFGGCLADDMGLGKTVQVLALLESRRLLRQKGEQAASKGAASSTTEPIPPSLVVVPKSLIFNWMKEAAHFAPKLQLLNNTGLARRAVKVEQLHQYDVILTTYGTLRNDVQFLKDFRFDYLILDEAQAIKNASTESAKAVRLLQGNHRLAMSGTPIENHVGELWSLFEFLNPGMLGGASFFRTMDTTANPNDESRKMLAHTLRPFILRRTKEQVAPELPAKTEQTVYCELEPAQRKLYNELRSYYRNTLLGLIDERGLGRSKMQVLEALLRLRQLACHPGLVDKKKLDAGSAKLDMLIPQLVEVVEEGHKVLVFSQFTSFLAIVKKRLDAKKINYEYLDGKTTKRQAVVERFQNDPDCKLFLISLKAGGLGLNLTAADYVFLLDPWWNPAVEAQAIDRAHRIGQQQTVFAYRLIARDTVEEKVLKLQESKRQLADAIINADNALIRDLTKEDLELLLS